MRVSLQDPTTPASPAIKAPKQSRLNAMPKVPKLKKPKPMKQPSMFGNRAMKSPEDYETGEAVQGLGRSVSPYYAQQYASKGQQLRYDTATNTYR